MKRSIIGLLAAQAMLLGVLAAYALSDCLRPTQSFVPMEPPMSRLAGLSP